jgi:hypothetical protein
VTRLTDLLQKDFLCHADFTGIRLLDNLLSPTPKSDEVVTFATFPER